MRDEHSRLTSPSLSGTGHGLPNYTPPWRRLWLAPEHPVPPRHDCVDHGPATGKSTRFYGTTPTWCKGYKYLEVIHGWVRRVSSLSQTSILLYIGDAHSCDAHLPSPNKRTIGIDLGHREVERANHRVDPRFGGHSKEEGRSILSHGCAVHVVTIICAALPKGPSTQGKVAISIH